MKIRKTWMLLLAAALCFGLACGRDDAKKAADEAAAAASRAAEKAEKMADQAREEAGAAMGAAKEAAGEAADSAREMADEAADAMGAPKATAKCKDLAAKGAWAEALKPCTKAHAANPDDMAIEHALQQAQAATK